MDVYIIRHGQSEADLLHVYEGRADFPLTELGICQAQALARWMSNDCTLNRIYASPLKRAFQTASILGESFCLKPVVEPDLMEWDNGLLAGMDYDEADRLYPKPATLPVHRSLYQTEPLLSFRFRAERVLAAILEDSASLNAVAAVTHGKMINQLCRCMLRLPLESDIVFSAGDTCVYCFRVTEDKRKLILGNSTEHLRK